ncbi:MAG: hypothetical protein JRF33_04155 [Deltaproteobacteria bacterium]|nr:hypothetical protein [Deltaproteobacteria bacterium]
MSSAFDKDSLLGRSRLEPGPGLKDGARFASAADYLEFLSGSEADPASYWMNVAKDLAWISPPTTYGEAGDFFPDASLNLAQACLQAAPPEGECLVARREGAGHTLSRDDLAGLVAGMVAQVAALGLAPGSPVLLALPYGAKPYGAKPYGAEPDGVKPYGVKIVAASLACLWLGLVCVPFDPGSSDFGRLKQHAEAAGCRAIICETETAELERVGLPMCLLRAERPASHADLVPAIPRRAMDPAFVLADSAGRTFTLPCAGLALGSLSAYRHLLDGRGGQGESGDLLWLQTPAHHASFLGGWLGALLAGGRVVLPGALDDAKVFRADLVDCGARVVLIQAKQLKDLLTRLEAEETPSSGRGPALLVIEGDSVGPRLYTKVRQFLFDSNTHITQVLSRPESGGFLAGHHPSTMAVLPASAGRAAPGLRLGVVDGRGRPCEANYGGLLTLAEVAPALALELQSQKPPIPMGLRVRIEAEGLIWSMGEVRVARQESNAVSASKLEAAMVAMEGVERVAVVRHGAGPDKQRTWAYVVLRGGPERLDAIRKDLAERFGEQAVPDSMQVVSQLPYSRTGKLLRSVLRRIAGGELVGLDDAGLVEDPAVIPGLLRECVDQEEED